MLGRKIIRHGDWFFVPVNGDFDPEITAKSVAREKMGNHSPSREDGVTYPYPRETTCVHAGPIHIDNDGETSCDKCNTEVPRNIYVNGQIKHDDGDHDTINLKDQWHLAVENGADVLMFSKNPGSGRREGRRE